MKLMKSREWLALLVLSLALSLLAGCAKPQFDETKKPGIQVGYAVEGVTAVDDPEAMGRALDEAYERMQNDRITLSYRNDAFSDNGQDFTCYIANHPDNQYDMFIGIYADLELTDMLYLSQLLRPGTAFETVKLNRALSQGDHELYVVFTGVETTEEEQIIHGETAVTMNFHVNR